MYDRQRIKKEISKIIGKENILFKDEDLLLYSYDATNEKYIPDLVVFPSNKQEIAEILKLATEMKFPVTPRGAGVGFSGGSVPIMGGVVLVTSKLNRILEIDVANMLSIVEPGVITLDFKKEVEKYGLFYPPDPASEATSTIGGNLAECAGGPSTLKYGVTRDYVLGLEVVLPTGEILNLGGKVSKDVTGYDLTRLVIGSEGTLCIITKAILRLIPLPPCRKAIMAIFDDIESAGRVVSEILKLAVVPSAIEFMDSLAIEAVRNFSKYPLPQNANALLIIEVDGNLNAVAEDLEKIISVLKQLKAVKVEVAKNEEERKILWETRKSISPALGKIAIDKFNEDIVVPRTLIPQALKRIYQLAEELKLKIVCFGHLGDGNIHVNIMADRRDKDEMERVMKGIPAVFKIALELGGTMSGEHGIGYRKKPYIEMQLEKSQIELMRRLKKAFDPAGILNPGKVIP